MSRSSNRFTVSDEESRSTREVKLKKECNKSRTTVNFSPQLISLSKITQTLVQKMKKNVSECVSYSTPHR